MMKRLAFCFDGTWNKIDGEDPTNVARVAQSISRTDKLGTSQLIYYDEGVGTTRTERWSGGIFGHGLTNKIVAAYHFLVLNYEQGDQIYIFGFSRGAFTARSFAGLLRNCGIMSRRSLQNIREAVARYESRSEDSSPNSESSRQFRLKYCPGLCVPGDLEWRNSLMSDRPAAKAEELRIEYLGVWDTVGALGIPKHLKPLAWLNGHHQFHDTTLSSFVRRARHAVSADERRRSFEPGVWTNLDDLNNVQGGGKSYEQKIFPGVHSGVGGGGPVRGLSDIALEWIFRAAMEQGLAFDLDAESPVFTLRPDPRAQLFNATGKSTWTFKDWLMGAGLADRKFPQFDRGALHLSLARRFGIPPELLPERAQYRPGSLRMFWDTLRDMAKGVAEADHGALVKLATGGDDRALRAPDKVVSYKVKPGDTLESIAKLQMGSENDHAILEAHNRNVGLIFEDRMLYAGSCIEVPTYKSQPIRSQPLADLPSEPSSNGA